MKERMSGKKVDTNYWYGIEDVHSQSSSERCDFIVDIRIPALRFRRARGETKLWPREGPSIDSRDLDEFLKTDKVGARPQSP